MLLKVFVYTFIIVSMVAITYTIANIFLKKFKKTNTFGILFANTSNLGDDVQTIAQMQFI